MLPFATQLVRNMAVGVHADVFVFVFSCIVASLVSSQTTNISQTDPEFNIGNILFRLNFQPEEIVKLTEGEVANVTINCTTFSEVPGFPQQHPDASSSKLGVVLKVEAEHLNIAEVVANSEFPLNCENEDGTVINIKGNFLGRTWLKISYKHNSFNYGGVVPPQATAAKNVATQATGKYFSTEVDIPSHSDNVQWMELDYKLNVSVIRKERAIDKIFIVIVVVLVIVASIVMGCKIDLMVVKEVLKKPFAPAIGFGCQFIIMPLVSVYF